MAHCTHTTTAHGKSTTLSQVMDSTNIDWHCDIDYIKNEQSIFGKNVCI